MKTPNQLREELSQILIKWAMPTRQVAINEIMALFYDRDEELVSEIEKMKEKLEDTGGMTGHWIAGQKKAIDSIIAHIISKE